MSELPLSPAARLISYILVLCFALTSADTLFPFDDEIAINSGPPTAHGRIVEFHRRKNVLGDKFPLDHLGIMFIPSAYDGDLSLLRDSEGRAIQNRPYVLHFTRITRTAMVRMDRIEDIVEGDPWSILPEDGKALPIPETIKRALKLLGRTPFNEPYNLVGNNCGNFVAYVKYGRRDADTQFIDRTIALLRALQLDTLTPVVTSVHGLVRNHFGK